MTKLSLARIMYGTNEDLHGTRPLKRQGASAVALPMPPNQFTAWEPLTLHELLHRLWAHLTRG
ncbi:MAG TPA: hypothetical protein VMJ35_06085 [Dongiaceae bacterium]|nr:hypothetical protein [Dongiaceae bacterium]